MIQLISIKRTAKYLLFFHGIKTQFLFYNTALIYAIEQGFSPVVDSILNAEGIDVNIKNKHSKQKVFLIRCFFIYFVIYFAAVHIACLKDRLDLVRRISNAEGADLNARDFDGI